MILYVSPKSLEDVKNGRASTIAVTTNPLVIVGGVKLVDEAELGLSVQERTIACLEKLTKLVEEGPSGGSGGKGKRS